MEKQILLMPDYGCWPLWIIDSILENVDPSKYISNNSLLDEINAWSDIYTNIDPQSEIESDYAWEIQGVSLAQRIFNTNNTNNTKYIVNFHSNILHKRSSNLDELLRELMEKSHSNILHKRS